jgi:pimeloyl-ACP methyl ester carboxylesterase
VVPVKLQQKMAAATPGARFVLVPQAGHMMPLEQPLTVAAALRDWLND